VVCCTWYCMCIAQSTLGLGSIAYTVHLSDLMLSAGSFMHLFRNLQFAVVANMSTQMACAWQRSASSCNSMPCCTYICTAVNSASCTCECSLLQCNAGLNAGLQAVTGVECKQSCALQQCTCAGVMKERSVSSRIPLERLQPAEVDW
jgi:hypothetical protein